MTAYLDQVARIVDLPDGAIAVDAVVVIGYLRPDGDHGYHVRTAGDTPTSSVVGLLAMASHSPIHQANPTPCEEDDGRG